MDRLTFLLLLLWVGVAVNTEVDLQKRIIGGHPCKRPFHVKLRIITSNGSNDLCGGSLVSEQWILTAAHCLEPGESIFAFLGKDGATKEVQITAAPVKYRDNLNRQHDLMLLKLPERSNNQSVALPDCGDKPKINDMVEIAGHAAIRGGSKNERKPNEVQTLRCTDIPVSDPQIFRQNLPKYLPKTYQNWMYQHWFCGKSSTVDACKGDSGGGVVYKGKIYGVISFTGDPKYVCSKAAAFMDLCNPEYAAWIQATIKRP